MKSAFINCCPQKLIWSLLYSSLFLSWEEKHNVCVFFLFLLDESFVFLFEDEVISSPFKIVLSKYIKMHKIMFHVEWLTIQFAVRMVPQRGFSRVSEKVLNHQLSMISMTAGGIQHQFSVVSSTSLVPDYEHCKFDNSLVKLFSKVKVTHSDLDIFSTNDIAICFCGLRLLRVSCGGQHNDQPPSLFPN